jgi:hypothetical protein
MVNVEAIIVRCWDPAHYHRQSKEQSGRGPDCNWATCLMISIKPEMLIKNGRP